MIRNTFTILDGIGERQELRMWSAGLVTWEGFLAADTVRGISAARKELHDDALREASRRLEARDAGYFKGRLPRREHWRLFECFRDDAVCLDIETDGLSVAEGGRPTVVGLYSPRDGYRAFVLGRDLTAKALAEAVEPYRYMITFYGSAFDIPFLERSLPGFKLRVPHFDLCFGLRRVGLGGGLKRIEESLGIARPNEVRGMDGYAAVLMWREAEAGSRAALDRLITYNRADTENLMGLADYAYGRLRDASGIAAHMTVAA